MYKYCNYLTTSLFYQLAILFVLFNLTLISMPDDVFAADKLQENSRLQKKSHTKIRKTKIIATLGPSSFDRTMIQNMIENGVDIFRLNLSHGTHQWHKVCSDNIRKASAELGKKIEIEIDLQGPKLRIESFKNEKINLPQGSNFVLDLDFETPGDEKRVGFLYPELYSILSKGDRLLLDDGNIILKVQKSSEYSIFTIVEVGGILKNKKGVNIPNITIPYKALTVKDKNDLRFAISLKPNFIALSFVKDKEDIILLKDELQNIGYKNVEIIAKIEDKSGLNNIDEIAQVSDLLMVARGDLADNISSENLFKAQNKIIASSNKYGKKLIVATQMMNSMINNVKPTNAEIIDVSYAAFNKVFAVMLSNETSVGQRPDLTVKFMDKILKAADSESKE